jgi:hypothetical protein
MGFDMVESTGIRDARPLVQVLQVVPDVGVIDNASQVTFEMTVIDHVKTN